MFEESDLLSQWRGYADDGSGVSIGFSSQYLHWLGKSIRDEQTPGFTLNRVIYDAKLQTEQIGPLYQQAKGFIEQGAFRSEYRSVLDPRTDEEFQRDQILVKQARNRLTPALLMLFLKMFLLKGDAFREEREWRLIAYFIYRGDTCRYRVARDRLIPYREIPLLEFAWQPIKEVILGPKHITDPVVIEGFLRQNGFGDVPVRRSNASYR